MKEERKLDQDQERKRIYPCTFTVEEKKNNIKDCFRVAP